MEKIDWEKETNTVYRKIGDDGIVLHGTFVYNYDDDCWRYAPDVFYEFCIERSENDVILESEAKKIVEENGGTKFDSEYALFAADGNDKFSGIYNS